LVRARAERAEAGLFTCGAPATAQDRLKPVLRALTRVIFRERNEIRIGRDARERMWDRLQPVQANEHCVTDFPLRVNHPGEARATRASRRVTSTMDELAAE